MYVSYLRVSTREQGDSGLGLQAQSQAVERFANGQPILATFTEVESGKRCSRPQLAAALAECKRLGATLLIAKLDRLARNVHFVSGLLESGVDFVCCDMPSADRTMLQMVSVFAEHEARCISERTRAALAAKKSRGEKWGPDNATRQVALAKGVASNQAGAAAVKDRVYKRCRQLRDKGRSLQEIASILNGRGERTRRGKPWTPTAVHRVLDGATGGHGGRF
jgi:DNA invertase Pin-like site-specific DNA recombinase